jgi:hypothetical protein
MQVFLRRLPSGTFPREAVPDLYRSFLLRDGMYEEIAERRLEIERPPLDPLP